MKPVAASPSFFIGWDVGAWHCEGNRDSRDAIVILDDTLAVVGHPWRGNLRECIAAATTTTSWLSALFAKCGAKYPEVKPIITMAIDTPLGFSEQFVALVTRQSLSEPDETFGRNRYLFRSTERHLFERGLTPMSAVNGQIGSQATKGMHVLAKFAPQTESCGVWTDGHGFRAIETYPTACRDTPAVKNLLKGSAPLGHEDKDDARVCAMVAHLFAASRDTLEGPAASVPSSEGWIWAPQEQSLR